VLRLAALVVVAAFAAPASASACDVVGAPNGDDSAAGTVAAPLRSAQAVVDHLSPGQTGCLRAGRYGYGDSSNGYAARFARPRVTLRSYPGEHATLAGVVFVTRDADDTTISDLAIDDTTSWAQFEEHTVEVDARGTRLLRDDITNEHGRKSCVVLGSLGWGRADGTVIRATVLHDCGSPRDGLLDHAIYAGHTTGARISHNVITGSAGMGIQIYPDAQHLRITHNLIADSGGGAIIFGGEGRQASNDNLVAHNLLAGSHSRPDLTSYWSGRVGHGNVARANCLASGPVTEHAGFALRGNIVGKVSLGGPARDPQVTDLGDCAGVV
jgi:hypothetical protein